MSEKLATLRDLEEWHSYDDALTMYEVLVVDRHNERVMLEEEKGSY